MKDPQTVQKLVVDSVQRSREIRVKVQKEMVEAVGGEPLGRDFSDDDLFMKGSHSVRLRSLLKRLLSVQPAHRPTATACIRKKLFRRGCGKESELCLASQL